jgi:hypothetical protein
MLDTRKLRNSRRLEERLVTGEHPVYLAADRSSAPKRVAAPSALERSTVLLTTSGIAVSETSNSPHSNFFAINL